MATITQQDCVKCCQHTQGFFAAVLRNEDMAPKLQSAGQSTFVFSKSSMFMNYVFALSIKLNPTLWESPVNASI